RDSNKPSGINTHRADPLGAEGVHEWLCRRYGALSIHQRLDKETSGVMVFGRSRVADQSLSRQFASHQVRKEYLLLTARRPTRRVFVARSGEAATEFELLQSIGNRFLLRASPLTGKRHQIRRHAAENGFPILGDTLYGGEPASRLMLHAHRLVLEHPASGEPLKFHASIPAVFERDDPLVAASEFRELIFGEDTTAFRLISGAADGFANVNVDFYDGRLLVQWLGEHADAGFYDRLQGSAVYEQICTKQRRTVPRCVRGTAEGRFVVQENGVKFLVAFGEGLSTGLFLDQRENRWRLLHMDLRGKTVLNTFAYTCSFSVAAAKAGAITTNVDLSRNYLSWGMDNFRLNNLCVEYHEFLRGDVFDWLKRFAKSGRRWDMVIVDPPTFSSTKSGSRFQAARDYDQLVAQAALLVAPGGWLFCSANQRTLSAERLERCLKLCGREVIEREFVTLPFDFRTAEGEVPYLKSWWAQLR
ncbi:MAG: class I SAM-dependent methyltransferase, partial [Verrucomicrobiae bacterium]|nr:class I SAM-dependent methyltransferase [Verrucomicrobiae bacterium]